MSSVVIVIAGVAIIAYTIGSQVRGTPIRAKRLIVLPGIITVIGVVHLSGASVHPSGTDVGLIAIGSAVAALTGLGLGRMMRLETRDGWLWGQLPRRGLWWWVAFFASRGLLVGLAHGVGAHVAGGTDAELLILGINRLGQALIIGVRAMRSGTPFAPESNGSRPLGGLFGSVTGSSNAPVTEPPTSAAPSVAPPPRSRPVWPQPTAPPPADLPPGDLPPESPGTVSGRGAGGRPRLTDLLGDAGGLGSGSRRPRRQERRARRRGR